MELPVKIFLVLHFEPKVKAFRLGADPKVEAFDSPQHPPKELLDMVLDHLVRVSYVGATETYSYTTGREDDIGKLVAYEPPYREPTKFPGRDLFEVGGCQSLDIELLCPRYTSGELEKSPAEFIDELVSKFGTTYSIHTRVDWSRAVDLIASKTDLVKVLESENILSSSGKSFMISEQHFSELLTYEQGWSEPLEVDLLDLPHGDGVVEILKEIFRTTVPVDKC